ncbi:MAG TPA: Hsp20/alpha crystallin family protein [Candidatus Krumholzibacteria bacterium]|nr:Hsp20/alpha crystallin family protein [Candidatus Krumholzibacteria bacterium]
MNTLIPMTRMLDAALSNLDAMDWTAPAALTPRADILEGDKEFRIVMDLPGIAAGDLEISVENQSLSIKAERKFEVPEGFETRRRERAGNVGFTRSFRLGNGVATDGITAKFTDGVLTLTLPKTEQSLPRRIEVR